MRAKFILGLIIGLTFIISKQTIAQRPSKSDFDIPYGDNPEAGKYIVVNGTNLYYETYGNGKPLMLIHGNLGNINKMSHQISYFSKHYYVIVPDCRGRGKSEMNTDSLTYDLITADLIALIESLNLDSCHIIGWSDGGIIGLLMGINYPEHVNKIVAMAANLWPDTTALLPWTKNWIVNTKLEASKMINAQDTSNDWYSIYQLMNMMDKQPDIELKELKKIQSPVLIVAGDKDLIRDEHTVLMYQNIPNAQLWIIPGGTHFAPVRQSDLFNKTVNKFLDEPFTRPDSKF
ncbi:alpha/beta fold hydrolase [Mariniphaga sp.]|uniref:alpha/beta fold hydrolase n=1 Tax=Mariniphaga sp. TaxID=1954475 RepID=UPI0035671BA8